MNDPRQRFAFLRRKARELAATRWSRKELAQSSLFKGAHQESIAPLLRDCPVKVLMSGDVLLRAGDACQAVYVVLSGRLQLDDPTSTIPPTYVRAGDCVGETFLMRNVTLGVTVFATEATRLLVIDRNTAWTLIRASHAIANNWLAMLAERTQVSGTIGMTMELKTSHGSETTHDDCTGLYNRQWLESMLPRMISRTKTNGGSFALLLLEIDGFAEHVAQSGTAAGDRACRAVAKLLVNNFRPTDLVTYYGTAQFAIVLPDADIAGACLAGERIRQAINKVSAQVSRESGLPEFTISIGATQWQVDRDTVALLTAAEAALLMAKTSGGNRVGMR